MICRRCTVDLETALSNLLLVVQDVECSISGPNPCTELDNLDNSIARLEKKRSELKRDINRTHSPFIRMIPPEIIAKISGFASSDSDSTIMGSLPAPILLSSVCSDWRRTVVGTPQLWSSIKIDLPSNSKTFYMTSSTFFRLAAFIDTWLVRSGQLPLNISIFSGHETPDLMTLEKFRIFFKVLDRYSCRWHILNISYTPSILSCLQPERLPFLEQLNIYFPIGMLNTALTFPPSPCLKTVGIHAFILPPLSDIGIQWDNVTRLLAASLTIHSCFDFLRLIPQLVYCKFHNISVDPRINLPESPILSSLTHLSLSFYQMSPGPFLDKVVLPSLKTLVLFSVTSMDPLMAFFERSACSLRTLSLQYLNIENVDNLTRLLQFLSPSLTKLVIFSTHPDEKYLSVLTKIYTSQSAGVGNDFLPHLKFFGYRYSDAFDSTVERPFEFKLPNLQTRIRQRTKTPISLHSAYIDVDSSLMHQPISQDILSILQCLNEDGILNTPSTSPLNDLLIS
jgi:hypothetical protein